MIVEYRMHSAEGGRTSVPTFIVDGGYFPVDNKYIGIAANDGSYIPSTLVVLDKAALITRLTNLEYTILDNATPRLATAEEIEAHVDVFISKHD